MNDMCSTELDKKERETKTGRARKEKFKEWNQQPLRI